VPLIDTHAHLTYPVLLNQIDGVLGRCREAGVTQVVTIGTDLADAARAVELAGRFPEMISAAAGFHPHHAGEALEEHFVAMQDLWRGGRTVAAGEMGLDYHYDFADRGVQRSVFARQLSMLAALDLPVIIHCREALDDAIPILQDHGFVNRRVVFHCFTGTESEAARIAEHGWRISFTGIVTFRNSTELQTIARAYPADRIMIETDSPYLSPAPVRGKQPNEPSHVVHVARFLAGLRGEEERAFAEVSTKNAENFFGLTG